MLCSRESKHSGTAEEVTRIVYLQTSVTFCYFYIIAHFVLGESERSHLAVIAAVHSVLKVTEVAKWFTIILYSYRLSHVKL